MRIVLCFILSLYALHLWSDTSSKLDVSFTTGILGFYYQEHSGYGIGTLDTAEGIIPQVTLSGDYSIHRFLAEVKGIYAFGTTRYREFATPVSIPVNGLLGSTRKEYFLMQSLFGWKVYEDENQVFIPVAAIGRFYNLRHGVAFNSDGIFKTNSYSENYMINYWQIGGRYILHLSCNYSLLLQILAGASFDAHVRTNIPINPLSNLPFTYSIRFPLGSRPFYAGQFQLFHKLSLGEFILGAEVQQFRTGASPIIDIFLEPDTITILYIISLGWKACF